LAHNDQEDYFYEALPFVETHPDHLGAIGTLFGLRPAPPQKCRLLEIGSATGGNILPLASAFPTSWFVGMDRAEESMAEARRHALAAGLHNVDLHHADVREFEDEPGSFDYIVCHGVYSWMPEDARVALRRLIHRHLAPQGLAYISFNTLPGWHLRGALRDMLRREVRGLSTQDERLMKARKFLQFLSTTINVNDTSRAWLEQELSVLSEMSDHYLLGEHLVEHNVAEYFEDFVRDMRSTGLEFVTDAHVPLVFPERLGAEAAQAALERGSDTIAIQQSLDYLELRCFRRAVLCRDDTPLDRRVTARRLHSLVISSSLVAPAEGLDLRDGVEVEFAGRTGSIVAEKTLVKAALLELSDAAPRGVWFDELASRVARRMDTQSFGDEEKTRLARNLLGLYTKGALRLWASDKPLARSSTVCPLAFGFARYQASIRSAFCTSLLHEALQVDSFDRALLVRMDGTRDVPTLVQDVLEDAKRGVVQVLQEGAPCTDLAVFEEITEQKLKLFAERGLLVEDVSNGLPDRPQRD
jgi:methyltransferase-like protein/ubiquinone/menaquinone biosynthesis C-methylase UbiE